MIRHKDEFEQAEFEAIKVVRSAIRLRHSIEADRELNEVLAPLQKEVRAAVSARKKWYLNTSAVFAEDGDYAKYIVVPDEDRR